MDHGAICEYLEWDSNFFGRRIARASVSRLTSELVAEIQSWCRLNRIDCVYFLADSGDQATARLAETHGFNLVDIRVTLDRPAGPPCASASPSRVRRFIQGDIPALRQIAKMSHQDSRFYCDGRFPTALCGELFEIWIEKSCRGRAQNVFVAEYEGAPVGYITCHSEADGTGQIGLISVQGDTQGRGVGKDLVCQAMRWFTEQGLKTVRVVTQGRNTRAQRLYQRCGFVTRSVELWYHGWFADREGHA